MSIVRGNAYQDAIKDFAQEIRGQMFSGNLGGLQDAIERLLDATISQGRGGDTVDAVEQGLVADGVTNNTPALQAIIDDLGPKGGGVIYIPAGTYKFTETVDKKDYPYIAIIGEGIDKTILDFSFISILSPSSIISLGNYTTLSGFTLLGPARLSGSFGIYLSNGAHSAHDVLISNVKVQEYDFGIAGQECNSLVMRNIYANDCANACVGIGSSINIIAENIFIDGAQDWGMYVSKPWTDIQNVHVKNIHIKNTNGVGFYWNAVVTGSARNIYIENCALVRDYSCSFTNSVACKLSEIYIKDSQRLAMYVSGNNVSSVENLWIKDSLADSLYVRNVDNMAMSGVKLENSAGNDISLVAPVSLIMQGLDTGDNGHTKIDHPEYITFVGDDTNSPCKFPFVEGIRNYNADVSSGTPAIPAEGTLTFTGLPVVGQTFVINATTLTIVSSLTNYNQIVIGSTIAEMCDNLETYFNLYSDESYYGRVEATSNGVDKVKFTWRPAGVVGNSKVFTEALDNCTADGGGTFGGTTVGVDEAINFIAKANGELKIRKTSSSGGGGGNAPLPSANDMMLIWTDTDDGKIYLVINDGGAAKKTQLV